MRDLVKVDELRVAIIGLGYVGLPLAVAFGKVRRVVGYDISSRRVKELQDGIDVTGEIENFELLNNTGLHVTDNAQDLKDINCFIVTVPTPVKPNNEPDLGLLQAATETVGEQLSKGALVVYESTVFPGCTEEFCVPILERKSGLVFNEDFFCGYSPERINPGDKVHRLETIVKVVSASDKVSLGILYDLYSEVCLAGVHMAPSIKVAEAAKVIENTQRDLNIGLMNELAMIFHKMNISTADVLDVAKTKWNFLDFSPGLVGGHCIGVDPFYLTYKASQVGCNPQLILAGRSVNDSMSQYVSSMLLRKMMEKGISPKKAKILILGLTFKENCPDLRNSKVFDVVRCLNDSDNTVHVFDPWVKPEDLSDQSGFIVHSEMPSESFDAIMLCVKHEQFTHLSPNDIRSLCRDVAVVFDLKNILPDAIVDIAL